MWSNQYEAHGAKQGHRTSLLQDLLEPLIKAHSWDDSPRGQDVYKVRSFPSGFDPGLPRVAGFCSQREPPAKKTQGRVKQMP